MSEPTQSEWTRVVTPWMCPVTDQHLGYSASLLLHGEHYWSSMLNYDTRAEAEIACECFIQGHLSGVRFATETLAGITVGDATVLALLLSKAEEASHVSPG